MKLNFEQQQATEYLDGPLLVLAGAGSGKTRVIAHKISFLVSECQYEPEQIAAITFTNKSALEMKARIKPLLPKKSHKLNLHTFHSLGLNILRQDHALFGLKAYFSIFDTQDQRNVLKEITQNNDKNFLTMLQMVISTWKNQGVLPSELHPDSVPSQHRAYIQTYHRYQETLRAYQAVDFDDLILLTLQGLEENASLLQSWQSRLRYFLVDEYQDTNQIQYRFLQCLLGSRQGITVVGDDNQAIYRWRGADANNLRNLGQDHPNLKVIKLEQNYRSTTRILQAANQLISHNAQTFEKSLWSQLGQGQSIEIFSAKNDIDEAALVIGRILNHRIRCNAAWSDYAILYRSNHQSRILEQILRTKEIDYHLSGGHSFFEKMEIRDLVAYLRLMVNEDDDQAFLRIVNTPRRAIGPQTLKQLSQYATQRQISLFCAAYESGLSSVVSSSGLTKLRQFTAFINRCTYDAQNCAASDAFQTLLDGLNYEHYLLEQFEEVPAQQRWSNVLSFQEWINRKSQNSDKTLPQITQVLGLMSILEKKDSNREDLLQLSTIHAAKGLEWKYVYIIGCEEDTLPHRESLSDEGIEEERRLMYVAVTRAQQGLVLSYRKSKRMQQGLVPVQASRFLDEMGCQDSAEIESIASPSKSARYLKNLRSMLN